MIRIDFSESAQDASRVVDHASQPWYTFDSPTKVMNHGHLLY